MPRNPGSSLPAFVFCLRRHLDVTRSGLLGGRLSLQDGLSVGVELQGSDDDVGRVDTDLDGGAVGSVLGDSLDVDDPLLSVDLGRRGECEGRLRGMRATYLGDLAILALVLASNDQDLVVLSDRDGSHLYPNISTSLSSSNCATSPLTLCLARNSLFKGELMIFRFSPEEAAKWAFRDFRRS